LARNKLQIPCPQCFEILKSIGAQRFICDNPKCHLLEVTAIVSYSNEKCETVYQYKRKEWVEGKTKGDYILLDREQLSQEAFCLRNFDDEETKSKCKSECIFGEKPFDLSLCQHPKNQDLVIRVSRIEKLFEV